MPTSQINKAILRVKNVALAQDAQGMTDAELLECFVSKKNNEALEAIVQRHGTMVWGVCRRVVGNHHDAEDAFQATFLVLVRKAASIKPRDMVTNWLYGVAHQTAMKARATSMTRKVREKQVVEFPEHETTKQDPWHDLQPLLDQELSRLPEKYRVLLVLCDLEGKTRAEVAQQLGCPEGTVAGRLARARTMLAKRLTRHGLIFSGGSLAAVMAQNAASASVSASLVSSTIETSTIIAAGKVAVTNVTSAKVAILTEGVLKMMLLAKLKTTAVLLTALLTISIVGVGTGLIAYPSLAAGNDKAASPASNLANADPMAKNDLPPEAKAKKEFPTVAVPAKNPIEEPSTKDAEAPAKRDGDRPAKKDAAASAKDDSKEDGRTKQFPKGVAHDFGKQPHGAVTKFGFPIKNTEGDPVKFSSVRASCGCVKANMSTPVLQANGQAELVVSVDTSRFVGRKTYAIFVTTESINGRVTETRFTVTAESQK
jgi:RNA polymerase sigma factor (sigma-70 family)